ncbi:MAG TPA: acyl-CoA carboxylase subunit epsilon [Sporichthya sp.]|nr:acyl-CoA carboxylase subunit epsilon [Sporichthya sp.]
MSPARDADETPRPLLRVVRGEPDDAELAALIAVVHASSGGAAPEAEAEPNAWSDRSRLVRHPLPHGPGAWRASAWRF